MHGSAPRDGARTRAGLSRGAGMLRSADETPACTVGGQGGCIQMGRSFRSLARAGLAALALALAPAASAQDFVNILTGGTSGVYYPLGVALSQIYGNALPDAKVQVQSTKASV